MYINIAYYFEKHRWTKVVFIISLIPFVLLIIISLGHSMFGFTFLNSTSYGFDAFIGAIVIYGITFSIIPILPICLIYDIIYLICKRIVKKERSDKNEKTN